MAHIFRFDISANKVTVTENEKTVWENSLKNLVLIGEKTTENGPWLDDHFLVLFFKNEVLC